MRMMTECLINVDAALALRGLVRALNLKIPEGDLGFLCPAANSRLNPRRRA